MHFYEKCKGFSTRSVKNARNCKMQSEVKFESGSSRASEWWWNFQNPSHMKQNMKNLKNSLFKREYSPGTYLDLQGASRAIDPCKSCRFSWLERRVRVSWHGGNLAVALSTSWHAAVALSTHGGVDPPRTLPPWGFFSW